tara:strand:+ start:22826 stop:24163 length:1338 start_codon:yes stop_codon:yes gene_type:complete
MQLDSLTNKGVLLLKPSTSTTSKTIVVVGVARGGTSIVAGSLKHLGLFMGNAEDPVFEDTRLSLAFEKKSKEKLEHVIADYNQNNQLWAWKRPSTLHDLPRLAKKLRNPHFIFVFRDLLSVANRNKISMKQGVIGGLESALDDYKKIIRFIKKSNYPMLLVSSEKVLKYKQSFIDALIDFASLKPSEAQIEQALSFITPDPTSYLKVSRIDRVIGWIDNKQLQTGILFGWAYQTHNKVMVDLCIYVNGTLLTTISADEYYADFMGDIHPSGKCAFTLDLTKFDVKTTDVIEIKAKDDDINVCGIDIDLKHLDSWLTVEESLKIIEPKGAVNLNVLQTGMLRGWAVANNYERSARIGIYINDKKIAEIPASIQREHLKDNKAHPTGTCGFDFNLNLFGVKPSDELEVKIEDSVLILFPRKIIFPELSEWLTPIELKEKNEQAKHVL